VAPNRYVVPALPGLAVLAGFGVASLARAAGARLGRPRAAAAPARVVGAALALALVVPGAARYLSGAVDAGGQRERDQRVLAAALPPRAGVLGAYAPTLLFDTGAELWSPWPAAGANSDQPIARLGVSYVLAAAPGAAADPTLQVPELRALRGMTVVAQVQWAGELLRLYRLPPPQGLPGPMGTGDAPGAAVAGDGQRSCAPCVP
jgi:hypothetical protein